MPRRFQFSLRAVKGVPIELPPAVERIARNGGVFKMIENGHELDTVSFDDTERPTEVLFVFGNDTWVRFGRGKAKP